LIDRLKHYFLSYKQLPSDKDKKVEIVDVYDRVEARDVITPKLRDYEAEFATDERGYKSGSYPRLSVACSEMPQRGRRAPASVVRRPTSLAQGPEAFA
jgi:hypothetical protein